MASTRPRTSSRDFMVLHAGRGTVGGMWSEGNLLAAQQPDDGTGRPGSPCGSSGSRRTPDRAGSDRSLELVRLRDGQESGEVTPNGPDSSEDLELAPLRRQGSRSPKSDGKVASGRPCCTCACVLGGLLVVLGLAAAAATVPQVRRHVAAESLQEQLAELVRTAAVQVPPARAALMGDSEGASDASAGPDLAVPPTTTTTPQPQPARELLEPEFCNITAPVPRAVMRTWDLPDGWKRVCEAKNNKDHRYPYERNWCWVGLNTMCHWNLKNHKPWSTFQEWASKDGYTPSAADSAFHPLENPELCDNPSHGKVRNWTAHEWATARRWFKQHVSVYVLSLPGLGDRRWHMIGRRLKELQIWATRVPGVDMRQGDALDDAKDRGFVPMEYNYSKAQVQAYTWKHNMGSMLGTVGCAAAHFKAQMKVIADGSPLAVIMEDDSYPVEDFIPRLWSLVRHELPCDWEVTALLSRCGYGRCISPHLMRVMPDANEPAWRCHQGSNWGMHAVLYRTAALPALQKIWKETVFNEERPHCMDVDVALASISDRAGFYAVPAVQDPGFVEEKNHRSARWDINQAFSSTSTSTSTTVAHTTTTTEETTTDYDDVPLPRDQWAGVEFMRTEK